MEHPKVSILCITYGHENYIVETLNGFLMQRYVGPVEIILSNDHSPDNTDQVIKDFLDKAIIPANFEIKYTAHEQNLGMMSNFIWALQQCTGKYIAMCEGDDYWTDPLKLQKQVDFLESNEEYILCYNRTEILLPDQSIISDNLNNELVVKDVSIEHLAEYSNKIHTPSVVFRAIKPIFPDEFNDLPAGDYPLYMYLAQFGKIKYLPDVMSIYRVHATSAWSSKDEEYLQRQWITVLFSLIKYFSQTPDIKKLLEKQLFNTYSTLYNIYWKLSDREKINELNELIFDEKYNFSSTFFLSINNLQSKLFYSKIKRPETIIDGRTAIKIAYLKIISKLVD